MSCKEFADTVGLLVMGEASAYLETRMALHARACRACCETYGVRYVPDPKGFGTPQGGHRLAHWLDSLGFRNR